LDRRGPPARQELVDALHESWQWLPELGQSRGKYGKLAGVQNAAEAATLKRCSRGASSRQVGSKIIDAQWKFSTWPNKRHHQGVPPKTNTHWSALTKAPGEINQARLLPGLLTAIGLLLLWKAVSLFFLRPFCLAARAFGPHWSIFSNPSAFDHRQTLERVLAGMMLSMSSRGRRLIMGCAARRKFLGQLDHGAADLSSISWAFLSVLWFGISEIADLTWS